MERLKRPSVLIGLAVAAAAVAALVLAVGGGDEGSDPPTTTAAAPPPAYPAAEQNEALGRIVVRVQRAAFRTAPAVAGRIIAEAEAAGRIAARDATALRQAARQIARGRNPLDLVYMVDIEDQGVRAVIRRSLAAVARRALRIGEPILARAVERGEITAALAAEGRRQIAAAGEYPLP